MKWHKLTGMIQAHLSIAYTTHTHTHITINIAKSNAIFMSICWKISSHRRVSMCVYRILCIEKLVPNTHRGTIEWMDVHFEEIALCRCSQIHMLIPFALMQCNSSQTNFYLSFCLASDFIFSIPNDRNLIYMQTK